MKKILFTLLITSTIVISQDCNEDRESLNSLKKDVIILSDDKMEGRETGTKGEKMALKHIHKRMESFGLETSLQKFTFNGNVKVKFNEELLDLGLYPTKYSFDGVIENAKIIDVEFGIDAPELNYSNYTDLNISGKVVVINTSSPDGIHPHSKYLNFHDLKLRAEIAKNKGAVAVIYYSDNQYAETPERKFKNINSAGIPVLFWYDKRKSFKEKTISFSLKLIEKKITAHNLISKINNKKKYTIIIGAHYDHLGWGGEGSLYRGDSSIHNGADDNASGTAAIIYLAEYYSKEKYNNYNYIFIAFSGEEKGLLGSNAFANSDLINPKNINYMINMDMIGRLNNEGVIEVYGVGSSPSWKKVLDRNFCDKIKIEKSESGIGSSDHTSFYLQDIPVLHFFTGTHEDYHKPSDDADKVNYKGMVTVISYIKSIINDLDNESKLLFSKTKMDKSKKAPKFSVTLGVVPNYMYSEGGMKIDGVNEGKSAHKSGMIKGDIVIQLGDIKITDMNSYMKALGRFEKGDKVTVIILREGNEEKLKVTF